MRSILTQYLMENTSLLQSSILETFGEGEPGGGD